MNKIDSLVKVYENCCLNVTASPENWAAFLQTACRNYKLRFDEQILIYNSRPDATAVLDYASWNKFGYRVKRGTKSIAVFEKFYGRSPDRVRLRHYFDVSDTIATQNAKPIPVWEMQEEYHEPVIEALRKSFGSLVNTEDLAQAVLSVAESISEQGLLENAKKLIRLKQNSFLEELDNKAVYAMYKTVVKNSMSYLMLYRLGLSPEKYIDMDDLRDVVNFNTANTADVLGNTVGTNSQICLNVIAKTVRTLQRLNNKTHTLDNTNNTLYTTSVNITNMERSFDNNGNSRITLQESWGGISPRSGAATAAKGGVEYVRQSETELSRGTRPVDTSSSVRQVPTVSALSRDSGAGGSDGGNPDKAAEGAGRRNGEPQGERPDGVGTPNEQHKGQSERNNLLGADLQLSSESVSEQQNNTGEHLDYYDRSNEDISLPFFGNSDTIREILATTPHLKATKDEILSFYESEYDDDRRTEYIKGIFNNDYTQLTLSDGRKVGYKTFQNVLHLWEGEYDNRTAQSFYDWGVIAQHFEAMRLLGELQDIPAIGNLIFDNEAEVRKPSAFSFSQQIIDAILTRGSGVSEGKFRIYEQLQKSLSKKENVEFLKNEYGWGSRYPVLIGTRIDEIHDTKGIHISKGIGNDKPHIDLSWDKVEKRIGELIKLERYLNPKEKLLYPVWLEKQEQRRAEIAEKRRNREILSTAPPEIKESEPEAHYEYHLGDKVYIGADEYEILSLDDDRVMLCESRFPLFNSEMSRSEFEYKVQESSMNDHLKVTVVPTEEKTVNEKSVDDLRVGDLVRLDDNIWKITEIDGDFSIQLENTDKSANEQVRKHLGHWKNHLVDDRFEYVPVPAKEFSPTDKENDSKTTENKSNQPFSLLDVSYNDSHLQHSDNTEPTKESSKTETKLDAPSWEKPIKSKGL